MTEDEADADLLELILELIGHLKRRLTATTFESFAADRDEIDLTAFRLAHIGEASKRLSQRIRDAHGDIRWRSMYDMRNILSHDYGAILPIRLWEAATGDLDMLESLCRHELERLGE